MSADLWKAQLDQFLALVDSTQVKAFDRAAGARATQLFELLMFTIPAAQPTLSDKDSAAKVAMNLWSTLSKRCGPLGAWLHADRAPRHQALVVMALTSLWVKMGDRRPFCQGRGEAPEDALAPHLRSGAPSADTTNEIAAAVKELSAAKPALAGYFQLAAAADANPPRSSQEADDRIKELLDAWKLLQCSIFSNSAAISFTDLPEAQLGAAAWKDRVLDVSVLTRVVWYSLALLMSLPVKSAYGALRKFLASWKVPLVKEGVTSSMAGETVFGAMFGALDWQEKFASVRNRIPAESQLALPPSLVSVLLGSEEDPIFAALKDVQLPQAAPVSPARADGGEADSRAPSLAAEPLSVAAQVTADLRAAMTERIPQDVDFGGTSAMARDADQLTRLVRQAIFLPAYEGAAGKGQVGLPATLLHRMAFERSGVGRKRRRPEDPVPDAPPLLPTQSELASMFANDVTNPPTILEKIAGEGCWGN